MIHRVPLKVGYSMTETFSGDHAILSAKSTNKSSSNRFIPKTESVQVFIEPVGIFFQIKAIT